jgi:hypothetical protein
LVCTHGEHTSSIVWYKKVSDPFVIADDIQVALAIKKEYQNKIRCEVCSRISGYSALWFPGLVDGGSIGTDHSIFYSSFIGTSEENDGWYNFTGMQIADNVIVPI